MLCVPEEVFGETNRKEKKRTVLYQRPCVGGLNFSNARTTVKVLRLSWIGRLLSESSDAWKAIPNAYFNRYGGLPFLLKCNYNTKNLDNNIPPFTQIPLVNYETNIGMTASKATKISPSKENLCIGKPEASVG